jgi:hypothetical protein
MLALQHLVITEQLIQVVVVEVMRVLMEDQVEKELLY